MTEGFCYRLSEPYGSINRGILPQGRIEITVETHHINSKHTTSKKVLHISDSQTRMG